MAAFLRFVLVLGLIVGGYFVFAGRKSEVPEKSAAPTSPTSPPTPPAAPRPPSPPVEVPEPKESLEPDAQVAVPESGPVPDVPPSQPLSTSQVETLFPRAIEEVAAADGLDPFALQVQTLDRITRGETTKEGFVRWWVREKLARRVALAEEEAKRRRREVEEEHEAAQRRNEETARSDMTSMAQAVKAFYEWRVRLPRDLGELAKRDASVPSADPWGHEYHYDLVKDTRGRGFRIMSAGRDGKWATADDLSQQAEATLK